MPKRQGDRFSVARYRRFYGSSAIRSLALSAEAAELFAEIRSSSRVKPADALHLAMASTANADYFVTNDTQLQKLTVSGIKNICAASDVRF
jgi:predicted nucleic acid-binding protein